MYNLKIITSGERIEIYRINNYVIKNKGELIDPPEEIQKEKSNKVDRSKGKRAETLIMARNNIIRLIKSNDDMKTFITLTFRGATDYKTSKKYLNNLFNKLRRDNQGLKYLWVLEYGEKNNRLHYHLLCNIPIEIYLSSSKVKKSMDHKALENEFSKKYWNYGFVDIRSLGEEGNSNIALYVSVYIAKSMENRELEGFRIYGYSNKTLNKPIEVKLYTLDSLETILNRYKANYDITYANNYGVGYEDYKGEHIGTVNYIDLKLKSR